MRHKRFGLLAMALALVVSGFGGVVPSAYAAAQTCTWTGTAGDNKFSTAGNWSNCNSDVPQAGDVISIDEAAVTTGQVMTNDLGIALGGLRVTSAATAYASSSKTVYVSALTLSDDAVISSTGNYSGLYVTIGTVTTKANIIAQGDVTVSTYRVSRQAIKAAGALTVDNYDYNSGDSFTRLIVGSGGYAAFDATQATQSVTFPIDFRGSGALSFTSYCATPGMYSCDAFGDSAWTLSGDITTAGTVKIYTSEHMTANLTGTLDRSKFAKQALNEGVIQFAGEVFTLPVTTASFEGDDVTKYEEVFENQTATLLGKRSSVSVGNGGILKGTGSVTYSISVAKSGIIAPGMSPGCLTAGSAFYLAGQYQFELGGKTACTEYDQIKVTDAAATYPIVVFGDSATIVTSRYNSYTPAQGDVFTIIDQAGTQAVDGTFKDLPEGATFEQNGIVFKVSYKGGDGNDVTLTVMNAPKAPDTGFKLLASQPMLTLAVAVMAALGLAGLARKLQPKR